MRAMLVHGIAAAALCIGLPVAAVAEWKPTKNVEIIVASAAGSGPDGTGRIVQRILQEKQLIPVSSVVVNKPGGQQTLAMNYLTQRADPHYVAVASTPLLSNHITGASKQHYKNFMPLTLLFSEYSALSVRAESPIKDARDMIERMRKDPRSLSFGVGTSIGGINHIGAALGLKAAGVDITRMKAVVFNGASESLAAVLGGHVDVVVAPALFSGPHVEAGRMRTLVVTAPERLPGVLATVPTWRDLGLDAVISNWRMLMGPKNMTPDQIAYWDDVFARLVATPEYQEDLRKNDQQPATTRAAGMAAFLAAQEQQFRPILKDIGLAQ